jgi:hypothetical protein
MEEMPAICKDNINKSTDMLSTAQIKGDIKST